ncbi:ABC transporter ATP-binding protein [Candidatus Bathyarchaeota archaeon]|nr:MAG: ABC transporter ATP-binding protein [Candidatus Bathyarchaeota archaeon]TMI58047.1 MAG: ABC transporter ATP-binding protein [Candidatus Bathyarchaeota archaeon]
MSSIEARDLTKRYGSFVALSNLNLKIEGAKCVGFLGPNGAGKTTTLKIFTDLIRASGGQALINGVDVHKEKKKALDPCGVLIETPEIYPSFTPREALSMIADLRGIPRADRTKRIEAVVSEVKMDEWMDKKVGKFSKGMKQRINIAAALLSDPEIVLLDEPTTGLDPRGQAEVRDIVRSLKQRNRLVFMSSHLLNEVSEICDEVAMIDHGKLLVYDTLAHVTDRFAHDGGESVVQVELVRDIDDQVIRGQISSLAGVGSVEKLNPRSLRIKFSGGQEEQARLLTDLVALKIGMLSYHPSASTLEDTYLNLIKDTL